MPETEWKLKVGWRHRMFPSKRKKKKGCISFSLNCTVGVFQSDADLWYAIVGGVHGTRAVTDLTTSLVCPRSFRVLGVEGKPFGGGRGLQSAGSEFKLKSQNESLVDVRDPHALLVSSCLSTTVHLLQQWWVELRHVQSDFLFCCCCNFF